MRRNWIAVVSAEHVTRGRDGGFMQVCHGKAAPLERMRPGDHVAYYSPAQLFRGKDGLQAFTALGIVADKEALPWNSKISTNINYRVNTTTLTGNEATGILDIL